MPFSFNSKIWPVSCGLAMAVLAGLVMGLVTVLPAQDVDQKPSAAPSKLELAVAIKELGSPQFRKRQAAHQLLLKAGIEAVDSLEAAAKSSQAELAARALDILIDLARDKEARDKKAADAAMSAMDRIAQNAARPVASRATEALADLRMTDADRALAALERAGSRIYRGRDGKAYSVTVASDADLEWVKVLGELQSLDIRGKDVTDWGILQLANVKGLSSLTIFESSLTKVGIGHLKDIESLSRLSLVMSRNPQLNTEDLRQLRHVRQLDSLSLIAGAEDLGFLTDLTQVTTLYISDVDLDDKNIGTLNKLNNVRRCSLSMSRASDEQLRRVVELKVPLNLSVMSSPDVTVEGWRHLAGARLIGLNLSRTSITDASLAHVGAIPTLGSMMIYHGDITDAGLPHLHQLKALRTLHLKNTKVTDEGVAKLQMALPNLQRVSLGALRARPAVRLPREITFTVHPETGGRVAHLRRPLTAADVDQLKKEPNLESLFLMSGVRDEDLRLLVPLKIRGLVIDSELISDAGIKALEDHATLEQLSLWSSSTTDASVASIGRMKNLTKLTIQKATISDEAMQLLVRELANRGKIEWLSLFKCANVTNSGLQDIGKLVSLKQLSLNNLEGINSALLKEVGRLKNVERLEIDGIALNQADLAHLKGLGKLETFGLSNPTKSPLTDQGLVYLNHLSSLKSLTIQEAQITDEAVTQLIKLKRLERLGLANTGISDQGLVVLSKHLPNLTRLGLTGTNVTDDGMMSVAKFPHLEWLWLDGTQVTEKGLGRLDGLAKLAYVNIDAASVSAEGHQAFQQRHPGARLMLK